VVYVLYLSSLAHVATVLQYAFTATLPFYAFTGTLLAVCNVPPQHAGPAGYFDPANVVLGLLLITLAQLALGVMLLFALERRAQKARVAGFAARHGGEAGSSRSSSFKSLDEDVRAERERLMRMDRGQDVMEACGLGKVFAKRRSQEEERSQEQQPSPSLRVALSPRAWLSRLGRRLVAAREASATVAVVQDVWLGVRQDECLGVLGPNGAGKTVTLGMLTGQVVPSTGYCHIVGADASSAAGRREAFRAMGICPQFDALFEDLTCREHLELFCAIKGVRDIPVRVRHALQALDLTEHQDKVARVLSGGNRRKLSFCIAAVASPALLILDEPSTGMDPGARRRMWDVVRANLPGRATVLTTHSMEEADALCSRIAVMVKGRVRALGTSHQLKRKFGDGYRLEARVLDAAGFAQFMQLAFPGHVRLNVEGLVELFRLPALGQAGSRCPLAEAFESLQQQRQAGVISEFALSQATLEQAFRMVVVAD
jgi:ABC-type multidrug transport system ATPase subunit